MYDINLISIQSKDADKDDVSPMTSRGNEVDEKGGDDVQGADVGWGGGGGTIGTGSRLVT